MTLKVGIWTPVRQSINPTHHQKEEAIRLEGKREATKRADRLSFESVSRENTVSDLLHQIHLKPTRPQYLGTVLEEALKCGLFLVSPGHNIINCAVDME